MRMCLLIAGAETSNGLASSATEVSPDRMGQGAEGEVEVVLVIVSHEVRYQTTVAGRQV